MKKTILSSSIEETYAAAHHVVERLQGQGVISLEGPLGAGKTHFVKGAVVALGLTEEVTSPTYTLLQSYGSSERRLHHLDFYRLKDEREVIDLGLEDYFSEGLTIIEWGNKFLSLLPKETLRITITPLEKEIREIVIHTSGEE